MDFAGLSRPEGAEMPHVTENVNGFFYS